MKKRILAYGRLIPPVCLLFDSDGTWVDSEILLAEVMGDIPGHILQEC